MKYYGPTDSGGFTETELEPGDKLKAFLVSRDTFQRIKSFAPSPVPVDAGVVDRVIEGEQEFFAFFQSPDSAVATGGNLAAIPKEAANDYGQLMNPLYPKPARFSSPIIPQTWYQKTWCRIDQWVRGWMWR